MIYLVISLFGNLIKFIQMMHIEDVPDSDNSSFILTKKQTKLLAKVMINLMCYFGLYFLSGQLDIYVVSSDELSKIQLMPAILGLEIAFAL
jgi:hypothetical protein